MGSALFAQAPAVSSLEGQVVDGVSGAPVVGAAVMIEGVKTTTDAQGKFVLKVAATGQRSVVISAAGHVEVSVRVEIVSGVNALPLIKLAAEDVVMLEKFVLAENKEGTSAKFSEKVGTDALTERVSGAALNNPGAQSSSDLLKNTSGVTVNGGGGGSSTVSVRGIDQRMLRITVDGQRQGGSGNPLDSIPAEIVQSLDVTKTFTPDMEADAVGGVINVNTGGTVVKTGFFQGRHQLLYNTLEPRLGTRNSFTVARPFAFLSDKPNASVSATVSFEDQYKVRERLSDLRQWTPKVSPGPAPYTGVTIPVLTLPLIEATQEHRQRTGIVTNADARLGEAALYIRGNFTSEWTKRNRNYNDTNPASGTLQSLTPTDGTFSGVRQSRRNQMGKTQRDAANLSLGGKTQTGRTTLDANLGYAWTHEFEPENYETGFVTDRTYHATYNLSDPYLPKYTYRDETNPADVAGGDDPKRYGLDYLQVARSDATDEELTLKVNTKIALGDGAKSEDYVKFGGKAQQRKRDVNIDRRIYDRGATAMDMSGVVGKSMITVNTVDYHFGALPNANAVGALLKTNPGVFQANATETAINTNTGDYEITEMVWALYGMGKIKRDLWTWIAGVRVEGTQVESEANQMVFDTGGNLLGFTPAQGDSSYVEFLPGFHMRYDPAPGMLYRASVTRSLSRPAYVDIAPYRTISFIDHRSRIGAPGLKPYESTNFDISLDKYDESYGLFSLAIFYKKIDHFITDEQYVTQIGGLGEFIEFRRINGESASAAGFEVNWQSRTWTLPSNLGKGAVEANYSFNHGEARHPGRPGEMFPLPRQVDHQANLRMHAERGAFSVDASVRYRTGWWEDLIAAGLDNYIEPAWDAEISTAYKIGKNGRVTASVNNLLNTPIRHYAGSHSRMNDYQSTGVDFTAGVQWKI